MDQVSTRTGKSDLCDAFSLNHLIADQRANNTHPLFDFVDGHAAQLQMKHCAALGAQGKAAGVTDERADQVDRFSWVSH